MFELRHAKKKWGFWPGAPSAHTSAPNMPLIVIVYAWLGGVCNAPCQKSTACTVQAVQVPTPLGTHLSRYPTPWVPTSLGTYSVGAGYLGR